MYNTSTLTDNILTNIFEKMAQCGTNNIGLSDHQMILCTRKTRKEKIGDHKHISFRSYRKYLVDEYKEVP